MRPQDDLDLIGRPHWHVLALRTPIHDVGLKARLG
jgi:hypothetical protein